MSQQFVVTQQQLALNADSLENSVPMTRAAVTQAEIGSMGGVITYSKGASIIRMMENTFGSDLFNTAVRAYLKNRYIQIYTLNQ
jgi:aminopeptidase N